MLNIGETVTLTEFRQRAQFYLNTAKKGPVYIRKGYQVFKLQEVPMRLEPIGMKVDENFIGPDDPRKEAVMLPKVPDYSTTIINSVPTDTGEITEKPCCKLNKPCAHWAYDGSQAEWKNSLSGRVKEVA